MKKLFPCPWSGKGVLWLQAILGIFFLNCQVLAQQTNIGTNTQTKWINGSTPSFTLAATPAQSGSGSSFTSEGNVVNSATGDFGTAVVKGYGTLNANAGSASVSVKDASNNYNAGNFVGFVVDNPEGNITVSANLNGTAAGSTNDPIIADLGGGLYQVGFFATGSFNTAKIEFTSGTLLDGGTRTYKVYYAVQNKFGQLATCNTETPLTQPNFNASVTTSTLLTVPTVSNANDVLTPSTTDYASVELLLINLLDKWISVKNNSTTYPAGTFAGFEVERIGLLTLDILGSIKIQTYLNGSKKEEKSGSNLLIGGELLSSSRNVIGFTTKTAADGGEGFDEVRIFFEGLSVGVGQTRVYKAVIKSYCEGPALACNTPTLLTAPAYPISADFNQAGLLGLGTINNTGDMIDASATNYATLALTVGTAKTATISVKKHLTKIPAQTFVGFDISRPVLLDIGLLDGLTIATFKDGLPTGESVSAGGLLGVSTSILNGRARQTIGFLAQNEFDEIKLIVAQGLNVNLGEMWIYGAVLQKFCLPENELDCNVVTASTNPARPVFVNGKNTGVDALVCAGCAINDSERVIDGNVTNYATMILAAGVGTSGSFAVANALETYPEKTFAGFDIATATLLSADILGSSATIELLNDGDVVQTGTGSALLIGASTSLLTDGLNRQTIGIVANAGIQYDEVKITFNQLAGANLGTIRIYGAIFTKTCAPTISCNETYYLNQSTFPAFIISERTGISGVVAALDGVEDAWNVVSSDKEDFATIKIDVGVAGNGSISVRDAKTEYPVGTTAGFTIGKLGSLVEADLFPSITITTYLDGAFRESRTGVNLINLELLGIPILGTGAHLYNVGFITTKSFDEVQITVGALVDVDPLFNATRVYGAYVDTRTSLGGGLVCNPIANPDFNVTQINVEVPGNVKTNDKLPTNTTYGAAVPAGANPVGGTLNLQSTGTYTFLSTVTGVFVYNVPANFPPAPAIDVPLVITVTDPDLNTNPPIANIDIASVKGHATTPVAVKINVKINDGPGNVSGSLGLPTIETNPAHGSVVVDGTGKIDYTPNAAFFGKDEFTYRVYEAPSGLFATAKVIVTVNDGNVANITVATDDYYGGAKGVTLTGNLLDNDTDPEGDVQKTVVDPAPNARVASVSPAGTFSVNGNGNFTFVPTVGFSGPAEFVYLIYDDGAPSATAAATVHFLVSPNNPLPVNLVRFDAKREGSRAVLSWATSEEVNADRFEVMQSNNGKSWVQIGTVLTTGTERGGSTYGFTDPEIRSGLSYYRLKNVDKDNTFEFSIIRSVSFEGSGSVADIYPNPAVGRINLNKLDVSQVARVQLVSQLGQAVYNTNKLSANYINVSGLNAGVYLLKIELKDGTVTNHKVIVSK